MRMCRCPYCNGEISYNEKYDAECCTVCDIWLENKCLDPECCYCVNRPEKPHTNEINKNQFIRRLKAILNEVTCMSNTRFDEVFKEDEIVFEFVCSVENELIKTKIIMKKWKMNIKDMPEK